MAFVLDCSVALAWIIPDEASDDAASLLLRLQEEGAWVPELWSLELANALLTAKRRRRLDAPQIERVRRDLQALPIEVDTETHVRALGALLELADRRGLTVYDAAYLELANRRGLPLATLDKKLRSACRQSGIATL